MNITEYVEQNNATFAELPFGDVDSLILCQFFYPKIEDVLYGDGVDRMTSEYELRDFFKSEYFGTVFNDGITDNDNFKIFIAGIASRRYRNMKLKNLVSEYDDTTTKQFAAVCFEIDDDTDYVCFRGTDGTMIGWKEDFELAFKKEAPSQADAVRYIETFYGPVTPGENKKIYIGGHSKGGNLAIYAGLMCDKAIHNRIIRIYSHDGPGFLNEVADKLNALMKDGGPEVVKQVPQASIIGMLLQPLDNYCVIKSNAIGIMQHAAFSWEIEENHFVELEHVTKGSEYVDRTVQSWLATADDEHRENFINALFKLLTDNGISTVVDLREMTTQTLLGIRKTFNEFDEETQKLMEVMIGNLVRSAIKEMIPENWGQEALTRGKDKLPEGWSLDSIRDYFENK